MSGPIRDFAEACWSGAVPPGQFWKPPGRAEELAPGVIFLHTFAACRFACWPRPGSCGGCF